MMNFTVNGNELVVNNKIVKFNYPIYKAQKFNDLLIVLLEFKSNYNPLDFTNALYAVSDSGNIVWKMEDVKRVLGKFEPHPLVNFTIWDGKLIAADFCSRKYTINPNNGTIIDMHVGRW